MTPRPTDAERIDAVRTAAMKCITPGKYTRFQRDVFMAQVLAGAGLLMANDPLTTYVSSLEEEVRPLREALKGISGYSRNVSGRTADLTFWNEAAQIKFLDVADSVRLPPALSHKQGA